MLTIGKSFTIRNIKKKLDSDLASESAALITEEKKLEENKLW